MSQFTFNDVTLTVDLTDADFMDACTEAFRRSSEAESKIPKTGTNGDKIRAMCKIFRDFFDDIYGEGTSEKLFTGDNFGQCRNAMKAFLEASFEDARQNEMDTKSLLDTIRPVTDSKKPQTKYRWNHAYMG